MFQNFRGLRRAEKVRVILTVLIFLLPMGAYAVMGSLHMAENKAETMAKYEEKHEVTQERIDLLTGAVNAKRVLVGTQVESIPDISVRDNLWKVKFLVWFRWEGDEWPRELYPGNTFFVGNGDITRKELVEEFHQDGVHYQAYRVNATIEKYFDTTRYPLDSHQLMLFIEDDRDISEVWYVPDKDNSGLNRHLVISGFDMISTNCGVYLNEYANDMAHPVLEAKGFDGKKTMEYMFAVSVNRGGYGLFLKAFLGLLGILLWVCIGLYNCAYNGTDAMGAISTGIFGVVSSMIVGMNLLSDARGSGLIEYVNFFSLAIILLVTLFVIRINHLRSRGGSNSYAACYAKSVFWVATLLSTVTITSFILCASM